MDKDLSWSEELCGHETMWSCLKDTSVALLMFQLSVNYILLISNNVCAS